MSVLVYCPLYATYPRLYAKVLQSLFELEWPEPFDLSFGVSKGADDVDEDRLGKLERARRLAINGGFDALLVVDYSVAVNTDTLTRLADIDAPTVSAVTVEPTWPHAWQTGTDSGCILYRREALQSDDWLLSVPVNVPDLFCARMSMEDGGMSILPAPEEPDRVTVRYFNTVKAPATVPYTRTLLKEAVPA